MVKKASVSKTKPSPAFYAGLLLIVLVGVSGLAYLATRSTAVVIKMDPNLPPVAAEGYLLGKPDAPVEILVFGDYECPACGQYAAVTEPDVRTRLVEPGIVRVRYMDFPLDIHRNTWNAAMTAACANDQGKFWEMHDRLYEGQNDWSGLATDNPTPFLRGYAKELGLDVKTWDTCYEGKTHLAKIQAMRKEAELRRATSTPTFIIGDNLIPGAPSYDQLKRYVDAELEKQKAAKGGAPEPKESLSRPKKPVG